MTSLWATRTTLRGRRRRFARRVERHSGQRRHEIGHAIPQLGRATLRRGARVAARLPVGDAGVPVEGSAVRSAAELEGPQPGLDLGRRRRSQRARDARRRLPGPRRRRGPHRGDAAPAQGRARRLGLPLPQLGQVVELLLGQVGLGVEVREGLAVAHQVDPQAARGRGEDRAARGIGGRRGQDDRRISAGQRGDEGGRPGGGMARHSSPAQAPGDRTARRCGGRRPGASGSGGSRGSASRSGSRW